VGAIDLETNNFFTEFPPEVVDEAGNPVADHHASTGFAADEWFGYGAATCALRPA
jgi:hypothetical protein